LNGGGGFSEAGNRLGFLCIGLACFADCRFSIAEAALDGLKPDKFATAAGGGSGGGGGSSAESVEYPPLSGVQQYLLEKHPQLRRPVEESAPLPLPAKAS
jgi:hypothetical protein